MGAEQGKEERVPELQGRMKNEVHGKRRHLHAEMISLEVARRERIKEDKRRSALEIKRLRNETDKQMDSIVEGITDGTLFKGLIKPRPAEDNPPEPEEEEEENEEEQKVPIPVERTCPDPVLGTDKHIVPGEKRRGNQGKKTQAAT